jgi:hypothetical protein
VNILVTNTKLCVSDCSCPTQDRSLCHPKHSELDYYVNEVIQLRQVICLYTKSYCLLENSPKKNAHTIGCITPFITLHITHVCLITHLILKNQVYLLIIDGYVQRYGGTGGGGCWGNRIQEKILILDIPLVCTCKSIFVCYQSYSNNKTLHL